MGIIVVEEARLDNNQMRRRRKMAITRALFCIAYFCISMACTPKLNSDSWIFLGMGTFDERRDTVNIRVGASEGAFSRLRFEVNGAIELNWVIVFFENGDRWSPNEGFSAAYKRTRGSTRGTQEFDLPDDERAIKRIELRVVLTDFSASAASVKVYGLKSINP